MYCRRCGNPIDNGASFCGSCGERIITIEDENHHNSSVTSYSEPCFDNSFGRVSTALNDSKTIAKDKILKRRKKYPISVIVLSALSLAYYITIVISDVVYSTEYSPATISPTAILEIMFKTITLLCFIFTPKSKAYVTIVAVWLLPISHVVSLYVTFHDPVFYFSMPFEIAGMSVVTAFAVLYTVFVAVKKARKPIFPILMLLLVVLEFAQSVFYQVLFKTGNLVLRNMNGVVWPYPDALQGISIGSVIGDIVLGILGTLIMTALVVAAFSLLPKKEN